MKKLLRSWGQYPYSPQMGTQCNWRNEIAPRLKEIVSARSSTLPYGNGRSYGDSCLASSDYVLQTRALDRLIQVDWDQGTLIAEAGISLAEILAVTIPNGWFLSVTPGTQFATLGGAVANDVHGKNHHVRGTFGAHVIKLGLQRYNQELLICSQLDNTELFNATIGGLGLTGVIVWAEIRLIPISSTRMDTTQFRLGNLEDFFSLSSELDHQHEYSVAWIDCLASGKNIGRGIFTAGNHSRSGALEATTSRRLKIPVTPPFSLINKISLRVGPRPSMESYLWKERIPAVSMRTSGSGSRSLTT
jgi:FAD/FMN-containing dehydrogenase